MKKLIIPAMLLALATHSVDAQSLYQAVYDKAKSTVSNPAATENELKENRFKLEALDYLSKQGNKDGQKRDSYFFDSQAVNLTSFISDFLTNTQSAAKTSKAKQDEMARCYITAATKFQLFDDPANTAVKEGEYIPFPLNTDWEKAYDSATAVAKGIMRKK
jgi:hypothetical protein